MNPRFRLPVALLLVAACLAIPVEAKPPKLPRWVQEALDRPIPDHCKDEDSAIVSDLMEVNATAKGQITNTVCVAIKVLKAEGRFAATAEIAYLKTAKISGVQAWLILPGGEVRTYKDKDFIQYEDRDISMYSEQWQRHLSVSRAAVPGAVFAYTYTMSEKTILPQFTWAFNGPVPNLYSRLVVRVPPDWRVTATPVNNPVFEYSGTAGSHVWQAANSPAVKGEAWQPRGSSSSYIGINLYPSEKDKARTRFETYENWADVVRFRCDSYDPAALPDDKIRAKVIELTRGCGSDWEKIQAIARYVQAVNYISISADLSQGGGYKPFPASLVFSRNYGDCKDKSVLMRAMLACIAVESYSVSCLNDSARDVRPEWPVPFHFNHAIVALRPPEGVVSDAIVECELGQMLIFDPTDPVVPVGSIPGYLENGDILISAAGITRLTRMPVQRSKTSLRVEASLDHHGTLVGSLVETSTAKYAGSERSAYSVRSASLYAGLVSEWLKRETRALKVTKLDVNDDFNNDIFKLTVAFDAPEYARRLGQTKLVVKPFIVPRGTFHLDEKEGEERRQPVVVPRIGFEETVRMKLPEGYKVDELPVVVALKQDFGEFEIAYTVEEGSLVAHRRLELNGKTVPAAEIQRVRDFFAAQRKAEQSRLVIGLVQ